MRSHAILASAVVPLILLLTACTSAVGSQGDAASTSTPPPAEQAAVASPPAVADDTTLIVTATVTAANGAQLALEMRVHQSSAWDSIPSQTLPGAVIQACRDAVNPSIFAQDRWSFTAANITATPTSASTADWPIGKPIGISPSADFVKIAGRGLLADDQTISSSVPQCGRDKSFATAGKGAFAIGIPGDSAKAGAAGGFTGWANHDYGFSVDKSAGVSITDCAFDVTPLGKQYGGGSASWSKNVTGTACVIGASTEKREE